MMDALKDAARMLNCPIHNEGRDFIPGPHIAVISDTGIVIINRCHAPLLPAEDVLVLAAEPKIAAIAYARSRKPAWVYFEERKLKNLQLPSLPKAKHIVLATHSDDYAVDIMGRTEDRWMAEGRVTYPFPDMTEAELYDLINTPNYFQDFERS